MATLMSFLREPKSGPWLLGFFTTAGLLTASVPLALAAPQPLPAPIPPLKAVSEGLLVTPGASVKIGPTPQGGAPPAIQLGNGGALLVASGEPVRLATSHGTVSTSAGRVVVQADSERVSVQVAQGSASLQNPHSTVAQISAGERAEGQLAPPGQGSALESLGQHEAEEPPRLDTLGMHEDGAVEGVAMAEIGSIFSSLGLHEVAATSILPFVGSTTGLSAVAAALARATDADDDLIPLSP